MLRTEREGKPEEARRRQDREPWENGQELGTWLGHRPLGQYGESRATRGREEDSEKGKVRERSPNYLRDEGSLLQLEWEVSI